MAKGPAAAAVLSSLRRQIDAIEDAAAEKGPVTRSP
jgi:hypothetical protein